MFDVIFYQCCSGSEKRLGETGSRLAWHPHGEELPSAISMGSGADWKIADVITYESPKPSAVGLVHFVYVHRDASIKESEREFMPLRSAFPNQSLEIQVGEMGSNFIGWEADMQGEVPHLSSYVTSYGISRKGEKAVIVEPWFKTDMLLFESDRVNTPFDKIYLSLHIVKSVENVEATEKTTEKATA